MTAEDNPAREIIIQRGESGMPQDLFEKFGVNVGETILVKVMDQGDVAWTVELTREKETGFTSSYRISRPSE